MHCARKIKDDLFWVGGNDRRLALFENVYPIPQGVSYNAYVLTDEQTVLLDTVDHSVSDQYFENLEQVLSGRQPDYLIVNHMEPDHAATLAAVAARYPRMQIVANAKIVTMIRQFFSADLESRCRVVKEGESLCTGRHTLSFVMAPMVHWPEVMVTYDATDKILFSADAFGTFGALNGNLFADEMDFPQQRLAEARRYYANIVGKYGCQVTALLKKAAGLEIEMICPLHGPVWRENIGWFVDKYRAWSGYQPEQQAALIVYGSVYGHTANAAEIFAARLADQGVRDIAMYDVAAIHPSYLVAEAFRCSHLLFACSTYNAGIFTPMETLLHDLRAHNFQNRQVALIENGSWASAAGNLMREMLGCMKQMTVLSPTLSLRSALKPSQLPELYALADTMAKGLLMRNA